MGRRGINVLRGLSDPFTIKDAKFNAALKPVVNLDNTNTTLVAGDCGKIITADFAPAFSVVLPSALEGMHYDINVKILPLTGSKITAASGDCFYGTIMVYDTDTANQLACQAVTHTTAVAAPGSYDVLRLEFDDTVTGGADGDVIRLRCVQDGVWSVDTRLGTATSSALGTIATIGN